MALATFNRQVKRPPKIPFTSSIALIDGYQIPSWLISSKDGLVGS
jgi:hypothetical protein